MIKGTTGTAGDLPISIIDTDLYKLTMQQAVLQHFPNVQCTYKFTNRSKSMLFSRECVDWSLKTIERLADAILTEEERIWLEKSCPYFKPSYLDRLGTLHLRPKEQLSIHFVPSLEDPTRGQVEIEVKGAWWETILYEVPVMAILSEAYFATVDKDWNYHGQLEKAYEKGKTLLAADISFSDFGTRRRRSYQAQELLIQGMLKARDECKGKGQGGFRGTSNPHFAHKYGLTPVGTIAHEWTMGIAALRGYEHANAIAMDLWEQTYPSTSTNVLHIALTDTFSSTAFFKDFVTDVPRAKRWRGLRQDSGDPEVYTTTAKKVYESIGIDIKEKTILYSDGLDVEKCMTLKKLCDQMGFIAGFGIGTSFTNDFVSLSTGQKSRPLNMVIKLSSVDGLPCVKISDEITKNTGDPEIVEEIKKRLGLTTSK